MTTSFPVWETNAVTRAEAFTAALRALGVEGSAGPSTNVGLTPAHLTLLGAWLAPRGSRGP